MRKLILVHIVHSPADLGSSAEIAREIGEKELGKERWKENQEKIEKFWEKLEEELLEKNLNWSQVKIYQDGFPAAGEVGEKVVEESAQKGSQNYQLVKKLLGKGAAIRKTESPDLLLKERKIIQEIATSEGEERKKALNRYKDKKDKLREKREKFIVQQIDQTLEEEETGLLFIGARHQIEEKLPEDIEVEKFINR